MKPQSGQERENNSAEAKRIVYVGLANWKKLDQNDTSDQADNETLGGSQKFRSSDCQDHN